MRLHYTTLTNNRGDALILSIGLLLLAIMIAVGALLWLQTPFGLPGDDPARTGRANPPAQTSSEAAAMETAQSTSGPGWVMLDPTAPPQPSQATEPASIPPEPITPAAQTNAVEVIEPATADPIDPPAPLPTESVTQSQATPQTPIGSLATLPPTQLVEMAKAAIKEADHMRAKRYLSAAREKAPDDPTVAAYLGITHTALQEFDEAIPPLQLAIDHDVMVDMCSVCLVQIHRTRREFKEAHQILSRLIARNPLTPDLYRDIAMLEAQMEDLPAAILNIRSYLRLVPDDLVARRTLADWLLFSGRNEESIAEWERLTADIPASHQGQIPFSTVLIQAGNHERARDLLRQVARANPDAPVQLYRNLSAANLRLGAYQEAIDVLRVGLSKYPKDFVLRFNITCAFSMSDMLPQALDMLRQLHADAPDTLGAYLDDPDLAALHADPSAAAWIAEVKAAAAATDQ